MAALLLLLLLLLLLIRRLFALPEDFFERSHFGKKDIAYRTSQFARFISFFCPHVVGQQLIRLCLQRFQINQIRKLNFLLGFGVFRGNLDDVPASKLITNANFFDPEVVIDLRAHIELLQRRDSHITTRDQLDFGRFIWQRLGSQCHLLLILATLLIHQFQYPDLRLHQLQRPLNEVRLLCRNQQLDGRRLRIWHITLDQLRRNHGFVQVDLPSQFGSHCSRHSACICNRLRLEPGVTRILKFGIGSHHCRELKNRNLIAIRFLSVVLNPILQWVFQVIEIGREDGIVQRPLHR